MRRTTRALTPVALSLMGLLTACGSATVEGSGGTAAPPRWSDVRPPAYSFVLKQSCGKQPLVGAFQVTVRANNVTEASGLDNDSRSTLESSNMTLPTIDDLLGALQDARARGADVATADYDPTFGYASRIDIDWDVDAIDDESCYRISNFQGHSAEWRGRLKAGDCPGAISGGTVDYAAGATGDEWEVIAERWASHELRKEHPQASVQVTDRSDSTLEVIFTDLDGSTLARLWFLAAKGGGWLLETTEMCSRLAPSADPTD